MVLRVHKYNRYLFVAYRVADSCSQGYDMIRLIFVDTSTRGFMANLIVHIIFQSTVKIIYSHMIVQKDAFFQPLFLYTFFHFFL